jgi:hypothetical protein
VREACDGAGRMRSFVSSCAAACALAACTVGAVRSDDAGYSGVVDAAPAKCQSLYEGTSPPSQWVYVDATGELAYRRIDAAGDHIMDFSYAGYMGGGVALPDVPVIQRVAPSGGDDTHAIQAALDAAASAPLANGIRGVVLLEPGTFHAGTTLTIAASGVVLRGSGSGAGGTSVVMTGSPHAFLSIAGTGTWEATSTANVTDPYVPAGATTITVDDASSFAVGDPVLVMRPVTAAWVHYMGMDTLVRDGVDQTWLAPGTKITADRTIAAIHANQLTLDVPLADSYDATYLDPPGVTVAKYSFAGRIDQVGVEHLQVLAPKVTPVPIDQPLYNLVAVTAAQDGWIRDVVAHETENSVSLDHTVKRFTIDGLSIARSLPADTSRGYPLEVMYGGSQILVMRSSIVGDDVYTYTTVSRATGPNVALDSIATGYHTRLEPHERWATGFLADRVTHGDALDLVDRGTAGTGHGWAIGWGVLWNSAASNIDVEAPPGSMNWSIGGTGSTSGTGTFDSTGTRVAPHSLYLAQLCARLGPQAVANIGYMP